MKKFINKIQRHFTMEKVLEFCRKKGLLAFSLIVVSILCMPFLMTCNGCSEFRLNEDSYSNIGDTFGGITGPFIAIVAAFLTFIAFWVQYMFNKDQSLAISKERFEHNFYELLSLHEELTNNLSIDIVDKTFNKGGIVKHATGKDVFETIYNEFPFQIYASNILDTGGQPIERNYVGLKDFLQHDSDPQNDYRELEFIGKLDHYFRQTYRVLKYINEFDEKIISHEVKQSYACIFRSLFSQYELILLFYNCLSDIGYERFKPLIERYTFFNNIRPELLATIKEQDYYSALKQGLEDLPGKPSERVYEMTAFVRPKKN